MNKYYVSYSPFLNVYNMFCVGGEDKRSLMQDKINAKQSDEIIFEVEQEEFDKLREEYQLKCILFKWGII